MSHLDKDAIQAFYLKVVDILTKGKGNIVTNSLTIKGQLRYGRTECGGGADAAVHK